MITFFLLRTFIIIYSYRNASIGSRRAAWYDGINPDITPTTTLIIIDPKASHRGNVEGKILLIDFLKIVKVDLDFFDDLKGESDSLAGLILEHQGVIPKIGDIIKIKGFIFQIESVDLRRIKRVKVTLDEV